MEPVDLVNTKVKIMSNFFGALDSDDDEPKIITTKKVTAGIAAKGACLAFGVCRLCAVCNMTWMYG
jgi:hypothetical protein